MKRLLSIILILVMTTGILPALADEWVCPSCSTSASGNFCNNCGLAKPADTWTCTNCGFSASGKFCSNCGTARPAEEWDCSKCGSKATGKFCSNCGAAYTSNVEVSIITPEPTSTPMATPSTTEIPTATPAPTEAATSAPTVYSVPDKSGNGDEAEHSTGIYTYVHDKWDLYKATVLSAQVVKIENWYRFTADDETPFRLDHSVLVVNTGDGSTDFKWLNDEQTAFSITMSDSGNSRFEEPTLVVFTVGDYGENAEEVYLTYLHDKWDQYRAIPVSDNVIRIENWYRFTADDETPFALDHSVLTVVTDDGSTDFVWLDDSHASFSLTMCDPENSRFTEPALVVFAIVK